MEKNMTDKELQEMRDYDAYMIAKRKAELEEQPMFWPFFFFALPLSYLVSWFASWVDRDTEHFRVTGWDWLWFPPLLALGTAFMMWAIIKHGEWPLKSSWKSFVKNVENPVGLGGPTLIRSLVPLKIFVGVVNLNVTLHASAWDMIIGHFFHKNGLEHHFPQHAQGL